MQAETVPSGEQLERELREQLPRIREAREKAVSWLTAQIDDSGRPAGAEVANAWWRAPWALYVGGAPDAAAAMIAWAERNALTDEGDLRGGPYGGDGPGTSVYLLSPIAIASWLLARYDTARAVMGRLEHWTDSDTGGAWECQDFHADPLQDALKTSQLGITALVTGRRDVAEGVHRWLAALWERQPELPERLYTGIRDGVLVREFEPQLAFLRVVDFSRPRQAYFYSGIAGAFLAGYGALTGDDGALKLGQRYLHLNESGTAAQFDDETSVQICKYGWGAAAMQAAAPDAGQLPWVLKMGDWFVRRQRPDGSWAPSSFMTPEPGQFDLYWKTAEHLMELAYIEQALRGAPENDPASTRALAPEQDTDAGTRS